MFNLINIKKMTRVNFKNSVIALAIGLSVVSCGGGGSKQQSGAATSEEAKGSSAVKPKIEGIVEGIFGVYGLKDEDVTPAGTKIERDESYQRIHGDNIILANIEFPNFNSEAAKAAFPDYIKDLMKAVANADDAGKPKVDVSEEIGLLPKTYDQMINEGLIKPKVNSMGMSWSCYYVYGGKNLVLSATQMDYLYTVQITLLNN